MPDWKDFYTLFEREQDEAKQLQAMRDFVAASDPRRERDMSQLMEMKEYLSEYMEERELDAKADYRDAQRYLNKPRPASTSLSWKQLAFIATGVCIGFGLATTEIVQRSTVAKSFLAVAGLVLGTYLWITVDRDKDIKKTAVLHSETRAEYERSLQRSRIEMDLLQQRHDLIVAIDEKISIYRRTHTAAPRRFNGLEF